MQFSINNMVQEISSILADQNPAVYLYGSSALNDFKLGWSDIDILVLTEKEISESQAISLVGLRQTMLAKEPKNPYYRSFEGGMLTLNAFLSKTSDRVVYWGTSGERITDSYILDSFGMAQLIESSVLLCGKDIRKKLKYPDFHELYTDVKRHYETIQKYAKKPDGIFILSAGCWIFPGVSTLFAPAGLLPRPKRRNGRSAITFVPIRALSL